MRGGADLGSTHIAPSEGPFPREQFLNNKSWLTDTARRTATSRDPVVFEIASASKNDVRLSTFPDGPTDMRQSCSVWSVDFWVKLCMMEVWNHTCHGDTINYMKA